MRYVAVRLNRINEGQSQQFIDNYLASIVDASSIDSTWPDHFSWILKHFSMVFIQSFDKQSFKWFITLKCATFRSNEIVFFSIDSRSIFEIPAIFMPTQFLVGKRESFYCPDNKLCWRKNRITLYSNDANFNIIEFPWKRFRPRASSTQGVTKIEALMYEAKKCWLIFPFYLLATYWNLMLINRCVRDSKYPNEDSNDNRFVFTRVKTNLRSASSAFRTDMCVVDTSFVSPR